MGSGIRDHPVDLLINHREPAIVVGINHPSAEQLSRHRRSAAAPWVRPDDVVVIRMTGEWLAVMVS